MSRTARLYAKAPIWLQNIMVSTYGLRLRYLRYGGPHREALNELRQSERWSAERLERLQLRRLNAQIQRARTLVPFYRERGGLPERDLRSLDEIRELPLLRKEDLRQSGRRMIADDFAGNRLQEIHTGGTTGKPLTIYCDRATLQRNFAFFERFKDWAGVRAGMRIATFGGRIIVPPDQDEPPFWRHNIANNALLLSSYHLSSRTVSSYVEELAAFRPDMLEAYPSSLVPIARHVLATGDRRIAPRAVVTSSETLEAHVREMFAKAFQCRVFDQYGSAELAVFVAQCEHGRYHPSPEFGHVEVIRPDGAPALPGETGEIVVSGFINPVMPLLRYAMGDLAVASEEICPCGRAFPVLEHIEGRRDDVIVTPEGRWIGRLDPIFKAVASLYETRIVQDARDHVRVETVVQGEFSADEEAVLLSELHNRLGPSMRVDIVRVPALPRTEAGKLRAVVNLVTTPDAAEQSAMRE
jgi:phenylacetate-CoA ligase